MEILNIPNRHVLYLAPKQPLIDWVNHVFPDDQPERLEPPLAHENANIYLIPAQDDPADSMEWLKRNFKLILEEELLEWCTDPDEWPEPFTWDMFRSWFVISIQTMIFDTVEEEIEREEI
jgi:hypothetical protein